MRKISEHKSCDFLVIGSGVAGLSFALRIARENPSRHVVVLTKDRLRASNSALAQGGVATMLNATDAEIEAHIEDTLIAGDGLCDRAVTEEVVREGQECVQELIDWGVDFDRAKTGELDYGREGGHSQHRILHHKDATGAELISTLVRLTKKLDNVEIIEKMMVRDLLTDTNSSGQSVCIGASVLDRVTNNPSHIYASAVILASGGIGNLFSESTNDAISTADGLAMAHRVGAKVQGLEFIQFHPTLLYSDRMQPAALITEAIRGQGAVLRNKHGRRFLIDYHIDAELAPRDVVSRAITLEMTKENTSHVYLDCTGIDRRRLRHEFKNLVRNCSALELDPSMDLIPVKPGAHYLCGGIAVNRNAQSTLLGLYAIGECAYTGLHGANRLASNSLLEALVYAKKASQHVSSNPKINPQPLFVPLVKEIRQTYDCRMLHGIKSDIQSLMSKVNHVIRDSEDLVHAIEQLDALYRRYQNTYSHVGMDRPLMEVKNMLLTARLILNASLRQDRNRGCFFNQALVEQAELYC